MTIPERHLIATRAEVTMLTIVVTALLQRHPEREQLLALIERSALGAIDELVQHPTPEANLDALRWQLQNFLKTVRMSG